MSTPLPVLFLDIDDVLCLNNGVSGIDVVDAVKGWHDDPAAVYRAAFAPGAAEVLERVHDSMGGGLRYVVSSTWRWSLGREQLREVFRKGGLGFVATHLHDANRWCTPMRSTPGMRIDEVADWLFRHHRGEAYAIVDDEFSGHSLQAALTRPDHPFFGRVVLCEEGVGLHDGHAQTLVDALSTPAVRLGERK